MDGEFRVRYARGLVECKKEEAHNDIAKSFVKSWRLLPVPGEWSTLMTLLLAVAPSARHMLCWRARICSLFTCTSAHVQLDLLPATSLIKKKEEFKEHTLTLNPKIYHMSCNIVGPHPEEVFWLSGLYEPIIENT
jgi:hypothetical protein